jgi:hypothetical protein
MGDPRFTFEEIEGDAHLSIDQILSRFKPSSIPYHLFIEGDFDADLYDLVDYLITQEVGLVGVANNEDKRAFALYAPALARAHRTGGWIYQNIAHQWEVRWLTHEKFIALYADKHNRFKRLLRFLKREIKKVKSFAELKIFVKKIVKILLKKVLGRG